MTANSSFLIVDIDINPLIMHDRMLLVTDYIRLQKHIAITGVSNPDRRINFQYTGHLVVQNIPPATKRTVHTSGHKAVSARNRYCFVQYGARKTAA